MKLYLVIPCYNEEEVLPETSKRLKEKYNSLIESGKIDKDSKIVLVNDGSKDKTWELIKELHEKDDVFRGIKLSRNRGHQNALLAGLMTVKDECDAAISLDADLQDDINAIDEMIEKYKQGADIVYGVRSSRKTDTFFKRTTARGFYKLMSSMGVDCVYDHADYRLMSQRALNALAEFKEVNLFLRGLVPLVGFKTDTVTYERGVRFAGQSKYPLKKMLSFAFEGITSMSIKPIKLITTLGIIILFLSFCFFIYSLISYFGFHASLYKRVVVFSIWALSGVQLIAIGVIGQYIGKIYLESKQRPRFIIEEYLK